MRKIVCILLVSLSCFGQSVGKDVGEFAFALNKQLEQNGENLAFSPYGIFSNFALLYFGAQGKTAKQMQTALQINDPNEEFLTRYHRHLTNLTQSMEGGYQLTIANGLFPHKGTHFLKQFADIARSTFDAHLQSVDYAIEDSTLETINEWINTQTRGEIPSLLQKGDIHSDTRLVAANAVFFEGQWVHPFNSHRALKRPFYPLSGPANDVLTFKQVQYFPYVETEAFQCVALPFVRKDVVQPFLECVLLLPKKDSFHQAANQLTFETFDQMLKELQSTQIDLEIPKFCFSKRIELNTPLKKMGMEKAFTYQANFSKIDGMRDLFINSSFHETYFSFDEDGVRAASATATTIGVTSAPPLENTATPFHANRPFLFFLVDYHTRAILFMGRVMQPELRACDGN